MKLKSVRGLEFCYKAWSFATKLQRLNRNIGFFGGPVSRGMCDAEEEKGGCSLQ